MLTGVDWVALGALAAALIASALAWRDARAGRSRRAAAWLALAALCLRSAPAARFSLAPWDERFHALVAKNALAHPLPPMLIAEPLRETAAADWRHAHVWLHKPPLPFWLMAGSMKLAGVNEIALRLPSLILSSLSVFLTFALARRFVSERAAVAAAAFQAWSGRGILLAAGLRATDHVDTLMTFAIALGALAAVRVSEALAVKRPAAWLEVAAVGMATGTALLVKDAPALIVPAFFFFCLLQRTETSWTERLVAPALAGVVALVVVAPWQIYTATQFPELAAVMRARGAQYFTRVVDEHGGPWYFHLANLARHFGVLTPIPVALFCARALVGGRALLPLFGWFALVYGLFTLAATKMEAYVFIASPVVFIALGWFVCDALAAGAGLGLRTARGLVSIGLVLGALAGVWAALDVFEPRLRDPLWARELRWLGAQVEKLPGPKRVVFGVPWPIECMFYGSATCIAGPPSEADLVRARELGFSVAEYGEATDARVSAIPFDPRTRPARRLVAQLQNAGVKQPLIFNAADAAELDAYLGRFLRRISVSGDLPEPNRKLARKLARGSTLVMLVAPGESAPEAVSRTFPDALVIDDAHYGRSTR